MTNTIASTPIAVARAARGWRGAAIIMMALALCPALTVGQNPPAAPDMELGKKVFAQNCIGCHGGNTPAVDVHDPLQPHKDLLRVYSDADIHNVTAFLVTLK